MPSVLKGNCKKSNKPMTPLKPLTLTPLKPLTLIFRRRNVPNSQYYFTDREHTIKTNTRVHTKAYRAAPTNRLLSYVKYSDVRDKIHRVASHKKSVSLKDNMVSAETRDLSQRLYIKAPADDVNTVLSIHPEFYTVVEGRPIRRADDVKEYLKNIRSFFMFQQQLGYKNSEMVAMDVNEAVEEEACEAIYADIKQHVINFQHFMTEDYASVVIIQNQSKAVLAELEAKKLEYVNIVSNMTTLKNSIQNVDSVRAILKVYKDFLIHVAPLAWRAKYDPELQDLDIDTIRDRRSSGRKFSKDDNQLFSGDVEEVIGKALNVLKKTEPAYLYFNKPNQMLRLYQTMELQCREQLVLMSNNKMPLKHCQQLVALMKTETEMEEEIFLMGIKRLEAEIRLGEEGVKILKSKFFQIINGVYCDYISHIDVLKLKLNVDFVYENVINNDKDISTNIHGSMKSIEELYENLSLMLDALHFETVNRARSEIYAEDIKTFQKAHAAERELKAFYAMKKELMKSFDPPSKYKRAPKRHDMPGIKKKVKKVIAVKSTAHKLTEEEKDCIEFFTEWCEGEDPIPYLNQYYKLIHPTLIRPSHSYYTSNVI